jgi:hypothetical protein
VICSNINLNVVGSPLAKIPHVRLVCHQILLKLCLLLFKGSYAQVTRPTAKFTTLKTKTIRGTTTTPKATTTNTPTKKKELTKTKRKKRTTITLQTRRNTCTYLSERFLTFLSRQSPPVAHANRLDHPPDE